MRMLEGAISLDEVQTNLQSLKVATSTTTEKYLAKVFLLYEIEKKQGKQENERIKRYAHCV